MSHDGSTSGIVHHAPYVPANNDPLPVRDQFEAAYLRGLGFVIHFKEGAYFVGQEAREQIKQYRALLDEIRSL